MGLLPFGGVPPKTNVAGTGITVVNAGSTSTISITNGTPGSLNYAQAYFGNASSWSTSSTSFVDPTNSGGNTLTVRQSSGITLTAAASNLCGITFTPASSTAIYQITASFNGYNAAANGNLVAQLTDGTTVVCQNPGFQNANVGNGVIGPMSMTGIYAPGTTSAVTLKIQTYAVAANGGTCIIGALGPNAPNSVEWTVTRIDSLVVSGSGITRSINSISTPQTAGAVSATDYVYLVSGTTTLTLPTAVGNTNLYTVKNTGSNTVSIATTSSQTIDGSASPITIAVANTSLSFISDNSNWRIV